MEDRRQSQTICSPHLLAAGVILGLGVLAYTNAFQAAFVFDDIHRIVESPAIRELPAAVDGSTRPLANLTFYLNYRISGLKAADFRVVNVALHLGAAWLLYLLASIGFRRMGTREDQAWLPATLVAALWCVHPVQTQSVTYIVQRSELMAGFFMLMTLYCLERSVRRSGPGWTAAGVISACLAMLSKPVAVVLPVLVLCYDRTWIGGSVRTALRLRWRLYLGIGFVALLPLLLVSLPNESTATTGTAGTGVTPLAYFMAQPRVVVRYISLVIWPRGLCLDYAWPPARGFGEFLHYAIPLGAVGGIAFLAFLKRKACGFLGVSFFVLLAPTSSVIPVADFAVEHRVYLASAALVMLGVGSLWHWAGRRPSMGRYALVLTFFVPVMAGLVFATRHRNEDYASGLVMMEDVVTKRPENFRAKINLAQAYIGVGRYQEAQQQAETVLVAIRGASPSAFDGLSWMHRPEILYPAALTILGRVAAIAGDIDGARACFEEALRADPNKIDPAYNLAVLARAAGDPVAAESRLRGLVARFPERAQVRAFLGDLLLELGRCEEARKVLEAALKLDGTHVLAKRALSLVLVECGRDQADRQRAVALATDVCQATGHQSYRALWGLAKALAAAGQSGSAFEVLRRALAVAEREGSGEQRANDIRLMREDLRQLDIQAVGQERDSHPRGVGDASP